MTVIVNYRASHDLVTSTSKQLTSGGERGGGGVETFREDPAGDKARTVLLLQNCCVVRSGGRALPLPLPIVIDIKCVVAVSRAGWIISGFCSSRITSQVGRSI